MITLAEHHRLTQLLLEHHRRDPDDEQTWQDYQQARAERDKAWVVYEAERVTR